MTTFSTALTNLKNGERVMRANWNGKGQYVYMQRNLHDLQCCLTESIKFEPVLVIKNAQDMHQPGWLPSMGDLLADDWEIYA